MKLVEVQATRSFISAVGEFRQGVRYAVDSGSEPIAALIAGGYLNLTCEEDGDGAMDSAGLGRVPDDRVDVRVSAREKEGKGRGALDGQNRAEPVTGDSHRTG